MKYSHTCIGIGVAVALFAAAEIGVADERAYNAVLPSGDPVSVGFSSERLTLLNTGNGSLGCGPTGRIDQRG